MTMMPSGADQYRTVPRICVPLGRAWRAVAAHTRLPVPQKRVYILSYCRNWYKSLRCVLFYCKIYKLVIPFRLFRPQVLKLETLDGYAITLSEKMQSLSYVNISRALVRPDPGGSTREYSYQLA